MHGCQLGCGHPAREMRRRQVAASRTGMHRPEGACARRGCAFETYGSEAKRRRHIEKWGPALLPAPTAPSEGSAGVRSTLDPAPENRCVTPLLDPGSPAQASLPTEQLPLSRSRSLPTRLRGPKVRWSFGRSGPAFRNQGPSSQNHPVFRGPSWVDHSSRPALLFRTEVLPSRVALEDDQRIRRLFPAGPVRTRGLFPFLPAEIGPLVTCRFLSPLPVP
jgi:hypothetical protein